MMQAIWGPLKAYHWQVVPDAIMILGRKHTLYSHNYRIQLQALWPLVASLDFSRTKSLCDPFDGLKELAKRIWPYLAYLSFCGYDLVLDICPRKP